jgi:hypothetical protein
LRWRGDTAFGEMAVPGCLDRGLHVHLVGLRATKKVRTDGSAIYVSNYLNEVRIPFDAVRDVTENRWINIHPVTIHFRHSTPFGNRIVFMPTFRFFNWRSHPVVSELRELAHI